MWNSYDAWKTACCGQYPNCTPCALDNEEEEQEQDMVVTYSLDIIIDKSKDEYEELDKIKDILKSGGYKVENWGIHASCTEEEYFNK